MAGRILPPDLDADVGGMIVQIGDQNFPDQLVKVGVLFDDSLNLRGERSDQAIGQKHAQERSHKRAADHLAQNFRWLINGGHGLDDTKNSCNNSKRG